MNVFHKAALESLKKNRTRTLITIIGVVLSAALFAAVATLGTSLLHYLILGVEAKTGGWCVEFPAADAALVQQCASDPDTAQQALVQDVGYAVLEGAKSKEKPYLWLAGFDTADFDQLPVTLISGRMPQNDHEVLVPNHVLLKAGVSLPTGQQLTLQVGQRWADGRRLTQHDPYTEGETLQELSEKTYTVVGTYARPGYEEHEAPGYTLITCADGPADSGVLSVTLRVPRRSAAFAARYAGYESLLNTDLLRFYGASENRLFNALLLSVGSVVAVIIMMGSMFLIYNAFNISLGERTREFGVLMSVGATACIVFAAMAFATGQLRRENILDALRDGME